MSGMLSTNCLSCCLEDVSLREPEWGGSLEKDLGVS